MKQLLFILLSDTTTVNLTGGTVANLYGIIIVGAIALVGLIFFFFTNKEKVN